MGCFYTEVGFMFRSKLCGINVYKTDANASNGQGIWFILSLANVISPQNDSLKSGNVIYWVR